jgi:hypothetical protein
LRDGLVDLLDAIALLGAGGGDLATMSVTRRTLATTSVMVLPACSTRRLPVSTLATESSISS